AVWLPVSSWPRSRKYRSPVIIQEGSTLPFFIKNMRAKIGISLLWFLCAVVVQGYAQERGKFRKNPKIKQNTTETYNPNFPVIEPQREPEADFKVETSNLQFQ